MAVVVFYGGNSLSLCFPYQSVLWKNYLSLWGESRGKTNSFLTKHIVIGSMVIRLFSSPPVSVTSRDLSSFQLNGLVVGFAAACHSISKGFPFVIWHICFLQENKINWVFSFSFIRKNNIEIKSKYYMTYLELMSLLCSMFDNSLRFYALSKILAESLRGARWHLQLNSNPFDHPFIRQQTRLHWLSYKTTSFNYFYDFLKHWLHKLQHQNKEAKIHWRSEVEEEKGNLNLCKKVTLWHHKFDFIVVQLAIIQIFVYNPELKLSKISRNRGWQSHNFCLVAVMPSQIVQVEFYYPDIVKVHTLRILIFFKIFQFQCIWMSGNGWDALVSWYSLMLRLFYRI